jgi:hypothetical protein
MPRPLAPRLAAAALVLCVAASFPARARAQGSPPGGEARAPAGPVTLDRVVARWYAPETGGVTKPQFIFERELAFEARVEAISNADPEPGAYTPRHVRAALDRHIAETLLSSLPIDPWPTPKEIATRVDAARGVLEQRVGGRPQLIATAAVEGIGLAELDALIRRQAIASLYLDKMVVPMLEPSDLELRLLLRTQTTPFRDQPFDKVAPALRRWFVGQRLNQALDAYYQSARSRVTIILVRRR